MKLDEIMVGGHLLQLLKRGNDLVVRVYPSEWETPSALKVCDIYSDDDLCFVGEGTDETGYYREFKLPQTHRFCVESVLESRWGVYKETYEICVKPAKFVIV